MKNNDVQQEEVLLKEELQTKFPLLLSIAPFFDQIGWFEQLIDFLNEIDGLTLFLPEVRLFDGTEIEINMLYQLLEAQFEAKKFIVELPESSKLFELETLNQHEVANAKIKKFVTSSQEKIDFVSMNNELSQILAKEYTQFLDQNLQTEYACYQTLFTENIAAFISGGQTHQVFILPIEMMYVTSRYLREKNKEHYFLKDYLEVFHQE